VLHVSSVEAVASALLADDREQFACSSGLSSDIGNVP
jgi:hypothetical protein